MDVGRRARTVSCSRANLGKALESIAQLSQQLLQAHATWPEVVVDATRFASFVAARARNDGDLDRLAVSDLYLAFACLEGDAAALRILDALCAEEAERARSKLGYLAEDAADVAQRMKQRLLVGDGGRPKLAEYEGTGPLRSWLRVALTRSLLNVATRDSREIPEDLPFFEAIADGASQPEAELLRASCRAELRQSLEVASAALDDRERALLRFAFRDRKTVEQIGAVYGVHGATASRWVTKARQKLVTAVRDDLMTRLKITNTEADSVLRGALSRVEVSLHRLLRTDPGV